MNPLHFSDVLALIRSFKDALPLLWKNKLWKGYFAHGPVSYLSIFVVLLLSYQSYVYFNPGITEKYKKNIKDKAVTELKDLAKEHFTGFDFRYSFNGYSKGVETKSGFNSP